MQDSIFQVKNNFLVKSPTKLERQTILLPFNELISQQTAKFPKIVTLMLSMSDVKPKNLQFYCLLVSDHLQP